MVSGKKYSIIIIIASVLFTSYLHYATIPRLLVLHEIYREFYYLPVLLAVFLFGMRGAILTYMLVIASYAPYVYINWTGVFEYEVNRILHMVLVGIIAVLAGFLVERDRKNREQLEKERYLAGIGAVATTIVHDLKNPLINILGFARRIREKKGDADAAMEAITDSALSMQQIVHDVLDFAKPVRLQFSEVDVRDVIRRACDACAEKAEKAAVTFAVSLPEHPVNIAIDVSHIERAIVNILMNAVEASVGGQVIEVGMASAAGGLAIQIKDNGSGMDKEMLENVFLPFYSKKSGGTGLGLPIAKKVVEGHMGRIRIDSKPAAGTEVTITLPYRPEGAEKTEQAPALR